MKRVAEGIYRRPSGKYVVPVYDPETRKRRLAWPGVPKGGFDDLDEAKRFKRQMEEDKRTRGSSRETCDAFAARWTRDYPRRSGSTNIHNHERVKQFAADFRGVPISDVTRTQAREWALAHRANLPAVRAMFNDMARDGLTSGNPFAKLGLPESNGREELLVLTEDEIASLVRTAEGIWGDYGESTIGPMIVVAAYTGMRPGELYALKWSRIDFEVDELQILRQWQQKTRSEQLPKHHKTRTITLLPQARAALQRAATVRRTEHDYVFSIPAGGRFTQRAAHYYWDPVRKAFWAGLAPERQEEIDPGFDFYELRHFYGTYLATHWNLSPYEIADQMGHADGGTLAARRYIHPLSRDVRARFRERIRDQQMLGPVGGEDRGRATG
jgi:integrase